MPTYLFSSRLLIFAFVILASGSAFAKGGSTGVGNGGHGRACATGVELNDLVYAKEVFGHGFSEELALASLSENQSVSALIRLFEARLPLSIDRSSEIFEPFRFALRQTEMMALVDRPLQTFDTAEATEIFNGVADGSTDHASDCRDVQIATRLIEFSGQVLEVSRSHWQKLGASRQALLLIHEGLRSYFGEGRVATRAIEQVVGYLASGEVQRSESAGWLLHVIQTRRPVSDHSITRNHLF